MRTLTDNQLLEAWAARGSDPAFAELVRRYVDLVYSAALRQLGDPPLAEDVVQAVFLVLARKAASLRHIATLAGWLYRTTRFTASGAIRGEARRRRHEQEAASMNPTAHVSDSEDATWAQVAPLLDDAMAALAEADRNAVLLRFFQAKPMEAVGEHLGITEDAAKKRVSRAVAKLRGFLVRRGVTLSVAALAGALTHSAVQAAPAALAAKAAAAATGAAASGVAAALAAAVLRQMLWSKLRPVFGCGAVAVATLLLVKLLTVPSAPVSAPQATVPQAGPAPTGPIAATIPPSKSTDSAQRVPLPTLTENHVAAPGEGRLTELYEQLLGGSGSQGFVSFERVIVSPQRGPGLPTPTAVAFCWSGAHYIIAFSSGAAVTNAEALASGDKLYGFDGEAYWCWRRNPPVRVYEKTDEQRGVGSPADSYTTLQVISKAEVEQEQGRYQPNVGFSTSAALAAECRQVVQFGFSYPLRGPPRLAGSDLIFESADDGATVRTHLAGDPQRPEGLSYSLPKGRGFRVLLDYSADTVDIAHLSGTNVTTNIRYHLLAASSGGRAQAASFFSWQTQVPETGRVMAEVVTNGATFRAGITTNRALVPEKMLVSAKPL